MSESATGVALVLALIVFAALYLQIKSRGASYEEPWLPREIRGAELAYSEKRFESKRHGLVARLDRAYLGGGVLHLDWWYDSRRLTAPIVQSLAEAFATAVMDLIRAAVAEADLAEETDEDDGELVLVDLSSDSA